MKYSSQNQYGQHLVEKMAHNLRCMMGIKENGIKHCYRADKRNKLLESSLKVLFIKLGWGATMKNQRMDVKC